MTEVRLDQISLTMKVGDMLVLNATVLPENVTDKTVTWSSSNPAAVKVENGKLTALAEGNATITAKCGEKSAFCTVTVQKAEVLAESVTLDQTTMELTVNGTGKLTATVKPDETTVKTIQWSSSDETVATVGADGTVTALKEGSAVITAKCGEKSAECTVTVKAEAVAPTSITMEPTTLSLTVGQTHVLNATVLPENATNKSVTWSSNAPDIVEVTAGGAVTAKAAGTATVTARAANGLAVTCIVTVTVTVAGE